MNSNRWPEDRSLFINGGPDDNCELWDVWHNGGPGGNFADLYSEEMALDLCAAIEELHRLRAENGRLRALASEAREIIADHLPAYEVWLERASEELD